MESWPQESNSIEMWETETFTPLVNFVLLCAVEILDEIEGSKLRKWEIQSVQILGQIPLFLQGAASQSDTVRIKNTVTSAVYLLSIKFTENVFFQQEVLRGEDRSLFCVARLLHWDAAVCCDSGNDLFYLRIPHLRWQPVEVIFHQEYML